MAERILGLDIGTKELCAVVLERPIRGRARVTRALVIPFSGQEERDAALKEALGETGLSFRRIVTALPPASFTVRHLRLPFRDRKKIAEVLPFELASLLPRPPGDGVTDFLQVGQGENQDVLALLSDGVKVAERLELLQKNGLKGAIVEAGGFVLARQAGGYLDQRISLILDLSHEEAVAMWLNRGRLCHVRVLTAGDLGWQTEAPLHEALTPLTDWVQNTQTFLEMRGLISGEIGRVYLTGSASRLSGFAENLAGALGVPVEPLDLARRLPVILDKNIAQNWIPEQMDRALALTFRADRDGFDFAKGVTREKSPSPWRGKGKTLGIIFLLLVFLAGVEAFLDYKLTQRKFFSLKAEVSAVFKRHHPDGGRQVDPIQQMKVKIDELKKEQAGLIDIAEGGSVLALLQELSVQIPAAFEVTLTNLSLEEGNMTIRGEARDFETVEKIRGSLAKSPLFTSVQLGASNLQKDGQKVVFDMSIGVKR